MSLLVIGTVAFDSVKTPFGEADNVLGGSATYFAVSASYFTSVRLRAIVGDDFPDEHMKVFEKHKINTDGLEKIPGKKTFSWKGSYGFDLNTATTLETNLNVLLDFNPELSEEDANAEFVFLANIDPSLQLEVIDQLKKPRIIALDSMNFWIENKKEELLKVMQKVDMVVLNEAEAREITGTPSLVKAAKEIHKMGPNTIIIKQGEYGSISLFKDEMFSAPAYPLEDVYDPTGAGDTFGGGVMGYLASKGELNSDSLRQAMIVGSAMASYNVESFSLDRITGLEFNDIVTRYNEIKRITAFGDLK